MQKQHRFGIVALVLFSIIGCSSPNGSPVTASPIREGDYTVQGSNPGGKGHYAGTLTMTKKGEVYEMQWRVGTTYRGIGIQHGNILSVGWGAPGQSGYGVVSYTIATDGTLTGQWATASAPNLGTETLTPKP